MARFVTYCKLFRFYPEGTGKLLKDIKQGGDTVRITFRKNHPGCSVKEWKGTRVE